MPNPIDQHIGKIVCADCLDFMRQLPDSCVDLILTDPPYGIGIAKNGSVGGGSVRGPTQKFESCDWDNAIPHQNYFAEMFRVSKNLIIWGGNYFLDYLPATRCMLTWYKRDGLPDRTFADSELAWTSFDRNAKVYNLRWDGFIRDSKEKKVAHPTQKPLELFKQVLSDFSTEGQLVLDPFLGSGTTAAAADIMGRRYIGIEISEEYCKISRRRVQEAKDSMGLFNGT